MGKAQDQWKGVVTEQMNPSYLYAYEKFRSALCSLATGPSDVRARLRSAYRHFHPVRKKHLPEHLQKDYKWVLDQLTRFGPAIGRDGKVIRGSVEETLRRIHNSTGVKIAERVLYIYHELNWLYMEGGAQSLTNG